MDVQRDKAADLKKLADRVISGLYFDNTCESGAPTLDPKRPFGSSSGVERDILDIIGWQAIDEQSDPSGHDEQERYARELYSADVVPYIQKRWKEIV